MNSPASFLDISVVYLKGIGASRAEALQKELALFTYRDFLTHYPFRYVDKTQFQSVRDVTEESASYQLRGQIMELQFVGDKRTKRLVAKFRDNTGTIDLVWFQGAKWMAEKLKSNTDYIVYGKATSFMGR
ncbi:MAG: ATP-dependent DNA helicase RecG, partial [Bacteroidia bacterium]|nr:ATP-dependent DNA helicase RecG [Bacteroidia bacterium]